MVSKFGNKKRAGSTVRKMPTFWSVSRWLTFNKCPAQYEYQYIQKLPQTPSIHLEKGIATHRKLEEFLLHERKGVPMEGKEFRKELTMLRKMEFKPEEGWTTTKTWNPCSATDWNHAWLRVKGDASLLSEAVLDIIDFKTGKHYSDHAYQAEVCAIGGFQHYPEAERVDFEFWYLDHAEVADYHYEREDLPQLKKKWAKNAGQMLKAKVFKKTPGPDACRFCSYRSDRKLADGRPGPCDGWKRV